MIPTESERGGGAPPDDVGAASGISTESGSRRPKFHFGSPLTVYLAAVAVAAVLGVVRLALFVNEGITTPFGPFYPGIALASYLGGFGPGLAAIGASGLFAYAFFPGAAGLANWIILLVFGSL